MRICLSHGLYPHRPGGRGCPSCARERDAARGTRRERGIGPNHEAFARMLKQFEAEGCPQRCALCGVLPTEDNPMTVGHVVARAQCRAIGKDPDDPANLQPECARCNYRKGQH